MISIHSFYTELFKQAHTVKQSDLKTGNYSMGERNKISNGTDDTNTIVDK